MSEEAKPTELLPFVTDIVAAHLSNNNVPSAELPQLIREVYQALAAASGGGPSPAARPEAAVPATLCAIQRQPNCTCSAFVIYQHI